MQKPMGPLKRILLLLVCSIGGIVFLLYWLPVIFFIIALLWPKDAGPHTKLSKYPKVLKKLPVSMMADFPKTIPQDPARVRLYYKDSSDFLGAQGGFTHAELWMKLDKHEIERLFTVYEKRSSKDKSSEHTDDSVRLFIVNGATAETWPPPWPPRQMIPQTYPLPSDFTILSFDQGGRSSWTHGVAISKKRNEIIYYACYHWST